MVRRAAVVLAFAAALARAQEQTPPRFVGEFKGKPLHIPRACSAEDIQQFALSCSLEDPCPVFLELTGIAAVANRLIVVGNLHTADVTLASLLLVSEDGGKTWAEGHDRLPQAGLDQVQFFDFQTGWISGQQLLTLPRDPFFLLSTDGGKTWRRRTLVDDDKIGTIESFAFTSPREGRLLLDRGRTGESGPRYEIYESQTGGESWTLSEATTRKPTGKALPVAPPTEWRVREDGAQKAYRIESRQGERWQTVALFQVRTGECKPAETVAPPEPTEAPAPVQPAEPASPPKTPRRPPSLKNP